MTSSSLSPVDPARDDAVAVRFTVHVQPEAAALSRVLELFVIRDIVPERVSCERDDGAGRLRIDIECTGLEHAKVRHLAERIRQFPTVLSVLVD